MEELLTVAVLAAEVVDWPDASYDLHVKMWLPLAMVAVSYVML